MLVYWRVMGNISMGRSGEMKAHMLKAQTACEPQPAPHWAEHFV